MRSSLGRDPHIENHWYNTYLDVCKECKILNEIILNPAYVGDSLSSFWSVLSDKR